MGTHSEYVCDNCGNSGTIVERYYWKKIKRIPNPKIFGKRAKPQIREEEKNSRYYCTKCHAENKDICKITREVG